MIYIFLLLLIIIVCMEVIFIFKKNKKSSNNRHISIKDSFNTCIPSTGTVSLPQTIMGVWSSQNDAWVNISSTHSMNCMYIGSIVNTIKDPITCQTVTQYISPPPPLDVKNCIYFISIGGSALFDWTNMLESLSNKNVLKSYIDILISLNIHGIDWDYENVNKEPKILKTHATQLISITQNIKKLYGDTFYIQITMGVSYYSFISSILSNHNNFDLISFMLYSTTMYGVGDGAGMDYQQWAEFILGDNTLLNNDKISIYKLYKPKIYYNMCGLSNLPTTKLVFAVSSLGGWTYEDWISFQKMYQTKCKGFAWWVSTSVVEFTKNDIQITQRPPTSVCT